MTSNNIHLALLRPPVLQILRAAGFHATRPAALDTLVDLALRYICLLASQTAAHASISHNELKPTISDVRMALQDVGALRPQLGMMEEQFIGEEDTRGVDTFLRWMAGDDIKEIRRVAGMSKSEGDPETDAGAEPEDFLTSN
jgi:transcription initiation factor TFIID subunit 3